MPLILCGVLVSLAVLGVDPVAEQIYRLLATRTSATAPEIAAELGLPVAGVAGTVEAMAGGGEAIRVAPELPMKRLVADRVVGMVPVRGAEEPAAIVVRESGVLDALVALFELVWAQSTPLIAGIADTSTGHDPVDGKILAL